MSNEVAKLPTQAAWTPEQMGLIKSTIARGATTDELQLFLYRCKTLGLDPLKPGQIHFVKYGNNPGTIVVGIDGFRAKAGRTGKHSGTKRGLLRDEHNKSTGAWAEVYRTDWQHPARVEVSLSEYSTGNGPWKKMPESMIQKVAEAAALRMAFPDELGGLYESAEMDQAEGRVAPEQPMVGDGVEPAGAQPYRIPFGKYAKRGLEEIEINDLRSYVNYLEDQAVKKSKPLQGQVLEFVERASNHIAAFENVEPGASG
jgi:phage recombination protein Bet